MSRVGSAELLSLRTGVWSCRRAARLGRGSNRPRLGACSHDSLASLVPMASSLSRSSSLSARRNWILCGELDLTGAELAAEQQHIDHLQRGLRHADTGLDPLPVLIEVLRPSPAFALLPEREGAGERAVLCASSSR